MVEGESGKKGTCRRANSNKKKEIRFVLKTLNGKRLFTEWQGEKNINLFYYETTATVVYFDQLM